MWHPWWLYKMVHGGTLWAWQGRNALCSTPQVMAPSHSQNTCTGRAQATPCFWECSLLQGGSYLTSFARLTGVTGLVPCSTKARTHHYFWSSCHATLLWGSVLLLSSLRHYASRSGPAQLNVGLVLGTTGTGEFSDYYTSPLGYAVKRVMVEIWKTHYGV